MARNHSDERAHLAQRLTDEASLGTTLLMICLDQFTEDFLEWEPSTLDTEVKARFGVELPDENKDKLWALVTALTTNLFYVSLETFIPVCNSLNGSAADFDEYDPVTPEEAAWGIVEVRLIDPPAEGEPPGAEFSHEVKRYIGLTLRNEGTTITPTLLKPYVEYDEEPEPEPGLIGETEDMMYEVYLRRQQERNEDINEYVRGRLEMLIGQLRTLPLTYGSVEKLDEFLTNAREAVPGLPIPEAPAPARR